MPASNLEPATWTPITGSVSFYMYSSRREIGDVRQQVRFLECDVIVEKTVL